MRGLAIGVGLLALAGCSSVTQKTAQLSGHALAKTGELLHPVQVEKVSGKQDQLVWLLKQQYDEPPVLDGFQMDYKARELCTKGYLKEEVYALRPAKFAADPAACVSADCRYTLVWKIRCEEVPQEPFSIFGKF